MPVPDELRRNPFPEVGWGAGDKPVLVLDGALHRVAELGGLLRGRCAYVVGVADRHFSRLCERLEVELLHFYEMRVGELGALSAMTSLRGLAIHWNTKVRDLAPIGALRGLRALALEDVPKARDLAPLAELHELEAVEFSGGIWNRNKAATLAPLAQLPRLADLTLANLEVEEGGLRPLAGCRALSRVSLSNQFPTEDYAYLSVMLPQVQCAEWGPSRRLLHPIGGKDIMVTGKGKPMLDSRKDGARLARYEAEYRRLQQQWTMRKHGA